MRNVLCVLALLAIAAVGVQATCVNQNCWHSKAGNFKIVGLGTPDARVAPNEGYVYMWGEPGTVGPPSYEASICSSVSSNNPTTDPQHCQSFEDHQVEKWKLTGYSDTCTNLGVAPIREVSGGSISGVFKQGDVQYCECYDYGDE